MIWVFLANRFHKVLQTTPEERRQSQTDISACWPLKGFIWKSLIVSVQFLIPNIVDDAFVMHKNGCRPPLQVQHGDSSPLGHTIIDVVHLTTVIYVNLIIQANCSCHSFDQQSSVRMFTSSGPPIIIMELCRSENLLAYLREKHKFHLARQKRFKNLYRALPAPTARAKPRCKRTLSDSAAPFETNESRSDGELPWPLPVAEMLRMAYQVASGMEYLQSKKVLAREIPFSDDHAANRSMLHLVFSNCL